MPRETIHGAAMPIDVEIAWGSDCEYVQVGSVHNDGSKAAITIINEWLEKVGAPQVNVEQMRLDLERHPETKGVFAVPHGWHATFSDRRAVNKLIEVLRRARDHAFGKDQ